jgi:hypothetical protein
MAAFGQFLEQSQKHSTGCIGFYWGQSPDELRGSTKIEDILTHGCLEFFEKKAKQK